MKLDFRLLDDFEIALTMNPRKAESVIPHLELDQLGPATTFCRLHRFDRRQILSHSCLSSQPLVAEFHALCESATFERMPASMGYEAKQVEFSWIPFESHKDNAKWMLYRDRLRAAARNAGFCSESVDHLSAAVGEMTDNAIIHSQFPESSIVGYAWREGRFDFVVSDLGVGIWSSLKTSPRFAHLASDVDAIRTAVVSGNSRFAEDSGHGFGFNTLIRGLQRLYGTLRVHSGAGCLDLQGESPSYSSATLRDTTFLSGTTVSIACRPD